MRKLKQIRTKGYEQSGFLKIEIQALKQVPMSMPYINNMAIDRRRTIKLVGMFFGGRNEAIRAIRQSYIAKGIIEPNEPLTLSAVWKLVRYYEIEWRNTAPDTELEKWASRSARHSHHGANLDREKLSKAVYRRNNRDKINRYERERRKLKRMVK